ncbi:MAG TPA: protein phosphatase 2C domain-containing protein [Candidatus Limnocylindrales bacterium]
MDGSFVAGPGLLASDSTWTDKPAAEPSSIAVSMATDVGRVRHNNEDFVQAERVVRDGRRYSLWVVADGVGGGPQGERASRAAVEAVVAYITHEEWDDPATALAQAFALANRDVYAITGRGAAASTMVAALVTEPDGLVTIANVGDSRAYLVAGGEAKPVTDDHSLVGERLAAGQITALEARVAPDRNVLTRSVGSEVEVAIDLFGPRPLGRDERLILCTDGIHGMIDDEAIGRIAGGCRLADSAAALVAAAVEAGGRDNATALVGGHSPGEPLPANGSTGASSPDIRRPSVSRLAILVAAGLIVAAILLFVLALAARAG